MEICENNRNAIRSVPIWLERDTWVNSLWNYGISAKRFEAVNSEELTSPNYTDLLCLFSDMLLTHCYLEIGVSSGRNLFPLMQYLKSWDCVGLDIEGANPMLLEALNATVSKTISNGSKEFTNKSGESASILIEKVEYILTASTNRFSYIRGDKFQSDTWTLLPPKAFSLVFSDAYHTPSSLTTELDFLIENSLLAKEELIFLWDDLHSTQLPAQHDSVLKLTELYADGNPIAFHALSAGTYGPPRRIGIFASDRALIPFGVKKL